MKTKQMLSILTLLAICLFANAQNKLHCLEDQCGFEPGQIVYLFGDQVQLRESPTTDAKVLKTLPIGSHMSVIKRHDNSWRYKGMDHPYYKVDYKGTEGYVLGGLLALEKLTINGIDHYFGRAQVGGVSQLVIRSLKAEGGFSEKAIRLGNDHFYLNMLGTKGLTGIDGMVWVDYVADACGVEGGGIYLFQQQGRLHTVARLSQVHDAGAYFISEAFIFPDDAHGVAGKIRYKKEVGEYFDEAANWKKTSVETKELIWTPQGLDLAQNR